MYFRKVYFFLKTKKYFFLQIVPESVSNMLSLLGNLCLGIATQTLKR